MGGLWEAAVKSMKIHLRKTIGEATLTYEEMATLLCRIEACLNSRPLTPLPDEPRDLEPLTPGHFLVGDRILSPPNHPRNTALWSREVMHQLQPRTKWQRSRENLRPGRIVLVKNDSTPPTRWPLAKVESLHPGPDGLVRVVTLRRGAHTFDRAITKLVPLPAQQESDG
ncbi:uncharacterized protein LOC143363109 [Halictus rubicundus]|uniref:uncharacterized protein LOC143363109 n=1 Tax=Halictus rubicundus TaxID=77578 RepID=UPI0040353F80